MLGMTDPVLALKFDLAMTVRMKELAADKHDVD